MAGKGAPLDSAPVEGAAVVTPETVIPDGRVVVDDGRIAAIEAVGATESRRPAGRRLVLPGLIDLHGDDVERHLFPRAGARIGFPMALAACDRANVAAGITTKFHAIAFEDAPDEHRSVEFGAELVDAVGRAEAVLADHRIHARCELADGDAVDAVCEVVTDDPVDIVSLMSHLPGKGQFASSGTFRRRYVDDRGCAPGEAEQVARRRRAVADGDLVERIDRVIGAARAAGAVVASHDDEHPLGVERLAERGVTISEYPVAMAAARRASELGLTTAMGAPNLVRGGSLWDNLAASDAVDAGVLDVLCSDYHPPSLLAAPFVDTGEPLAVRVARVTKAPADAVGLSDRGRIEEGARADLVVVDPDPTPTVQRVLVAGREVYRAGRPTPSGLDDR